MLPMAPIYARGHVRRPDKDHLQAVSAMQFGRHLQAMLADPMPAAYSAKAFYSPVKNQKQCGSCWDFSGVAMIEAAFAAAGMPGLVLSEEYVLSCQRNGGCNGDDNTTVLDIAKSTGLPLTSDYGPYTAQRGTCNYKPGMKMFKIDSWGFANASGDTGQNVTPEADIKATLFRYKNIGNAVAAGGDQFWNTGTGTGTGRSNSIDHDINIVGWDDDHDNGDGTKGAWEVRNSWDVTWGNGGYAWIKYGAYSVGTEAVFAYVQPQTADYTP